MALAPCLLWICKVAKQKLWSENAGSRWKSTGRREKEVDILNLEDKKRRICRCTFELLLQIQELVDYTLQWFLYREELEEDGNMDLEGVITLVEG